MSLCCFETAVATADNPSENLDPTETTGSQASATGTGGDKIANELLDNSRAVRLFCMGIVEASVEGWRGCLGVSCNGGK